MYSDIFIKCYGLQAPFVYRKRIMKCKRRLHRTLFKITNSVYKSKLSKPIDLNFVACQVPRSVLYNSQPRMLLISNGAVKLIFFKSGKFRLMGGGFHPTNRNAFMQLSTFFPVLPHSIVTQLKRVKLTCQTMTVTFSLFQAVKLRELHERILKHNKGKNVGYCELECFPSLMIKLWDPIHINVFASGKVVLTGIKQYNFRQCYVIKRWLQRNVRNICK